MLKAKEMLLMGGSLCGIHFAAPLTAQRVALVVALLAAALLAALLVSRASSAASLAARFGITW